MWLVFKRNMSREFVTKVTLKKKQNLNICMKFFSQLQSFFMFGWVVRGSAAFMSCNAEQQLI